jgi:signal transduction histidine kinase
VFRWAELREQHADLAVPFIIMATVFGLLVVSFPVYEGIIPQNGYSLLNLIIPAAMLVPWGVFGLRYAGRDHLLTIPRVAGSALILSLFIGVFVSSVTGRAPSSTVVTVSLGIGIVGLLGGTFAIAGVVLLVSYRDSELPMGQSIAVVLPVVALLMTAQGLRTDPNTRMLLNTAVFALATGSLWVAVTGYDALTRRPGTSRLGLRSVVTEMDEAVFVVNTAGRVVSANAAAQSLFGADVIGDVFDNILGHPVSTLRDRETLEQQTSTGYRQFDPRVSTITGGGGQRLGVAITLIDVTDREMRRQRIQVLNRILRHNVRNDLDAVLAHTSRIDDEAIQSSIERIVDGTVRLSTKAREAEKIMTVVTDQPEPVDLAAVATSVADRFRSSEYVGDIDVSTTELHIVSYQSVVRRILHELVENALEHSDSDTVSVRIIVRPGPDGAAELVVADDGPGLPEWVHEVLAAGTETQLKHNQGIGLWFVRWAVTQLSGELVVEQNDPTDTVVTVRLDDSVT